MSGLTLRDAIISDAAELSRLTAELGYAADEESTRRRLEHLLQRADQRVSVAIVDHCIGGWLQAHASTVLESGFRVEIVGLVVAERYRRRGIGRALVGQAEHWAIQLGAETIVVRSNTVRVASHAFYPALGYAPAKTQAVYRKRLPPKSA